ncbi:hypothetical protein [Sphingobacterium mizutaii]|uniref:hypothetical protein n=1 Tax=Sphingobacterium mizutaii TaxID=1010 RepID=UPI00162A9882|nr:hypothetical protein [Sphingobacterium mizutaii]
MKQLKVNLLMITALAIGAVTMSFKMFDKPSSTVAAKYWFQMNAAGTTPLQGPITNVDDLCPNQLEQPDCARLYDETQTTGTGSSRTVKPAEINNHEDFRSKE